MKVCCVTGTPYHTLDAYCPQCIPPGHLDFFFVADEIIASWYSILPTVKFFSLAYSVRRDIVLNKWASSCSASIYPSYIAYINLFLLLTLMLALDCALRLFTCKADTKH